MTQKLFLLVGIVALLTGCTLIPKYTRPEVPVPSSWPSGPAYKETKATPGAPAATELKCWEFFTDDRLLPDTKKWGVIFHNPPFLISHFGAEGGTRTRIA
jgi:hypothetical protein